MVFPRISSKEDTHVLILSRMRQEYSIFIFTNTHTVNSPVCACVCVCNKCTIARVNISNYKFKINTAREHVRASRSNIALQRGVVL